MGRVGASDAEWRQDRWTLQNEVFRRLAEMGDTNPGLIGGNGREPLVVAMKAMVLVNRLRDEGKTEFTDEELLTVLWTAVALTPRAYGEEKAKKDGETGAIL